VSNAISEESPRTAATSSAAIIFMHIIVQQNSYIRIKVKIVVVVVVVVVVTGKGGNCALATKDKMLNFKV